MIKVLLLTTLSFLSFCFYQNSNLNSQNLNAHINGTPQYSTKPNSESGIEEKKQLDSKELVLKVRKYHDAKLETIYFFDAKNRLRKTITYTGQEPIKEEATEYFYKENGELDHTIPEETDPDLKALSDKLDRDFEINVEFIRENKISVPLYADVLIPSEIVGVSSVLTVLFEVDKSGKSKVIKKGNLKIMSFKGKDFTIRLYPWETFLAQDEPIYGYELTLRDDYIVKEKYHTGPSSLRNDPNPSITTREFICDKKMRLSKVKVTSFSMKGIKDYSSEKRFEYEEIKH